MKKIVILFLLSTSILAVSCTNKEKKEQEEDEMEDLTKSEETEKSEAVVVNQVGGYGIEINAENAIAVTELVADMQKANGFEGKVKGEIEECCQNKGCWMKMDLGNGETMRISFKDYGFFVPKDIPGKTVVVNGKAEVKEISIEELKHFATDAGKSQAEIDAITETKKELVFVADGVIAI